MRTLRFTKPVQNKVTWGVLLGLLLLTALAAIRPIRAADTPTPTPLMNDLLTQVPIALTEASAANAQANAASAQANAASSQASSAIGQAGLVLNFIQVAAILGGVAATLIGYFFAVRGLHTLNDYQQDLGKARADLDVMRTQLTDATNQALQARRDLEAGSVKQLADVQAQAAAAYRGFSLLQIGQQQFEIGNIQAAQQMYEEAYQLNPDSQISNYLLGELYLAERDIPRAVEHLERALKLAPNLAPTYAALGLARRLQADKQSDPGKRNQRYAEAEQLLLKAIEINPGARDANKESTYSALGALYRRQGRVNDAIDAYSAAEKITPNNSYPVVNLAQLHFVHGDIDAAKTYFARALSASRRALDSNPSDPWARQDVITAQLALGEAAEAFQQLEVALKQTHGLGQLEALLSGFVMLQKAPHPPPRIDEAIAAVEAAITRLKTAHPVDGKP